MVEYSDIPGRGWHETGLSPEAREMIVMSVHLINNQLMIISGNLQLLIMETNPSKQTENGIKMILEEVGKMKEAIRGLNDFSRALQMQSSDSDE